MKSNHRAKPPGPSSSWSVYYDKVGLGPPRPTLLRALELFEAEGTPPGRAVDLGCGVGRDALELLRRGWRVTGVDSEPEALARLAAEARSRDLPAPDLVPAPFEEADIPPCLLANASFAIFFCPPAAFATAWERVRAALPPGGRFAGQLLGPGDTWAADPGVTSHDEAALDALLDGYEVERKEREVTDSVTPMGEAKRWDIWHLVLRRL